MQSNSEQWVEAWNKAAAALEAERLETLASFDYRAHVEGIDTLLDWVAQHHQIRRSSGLVELQRILHQK
jgi:hypothetical protein